MQYRIPRLSPDLYLSSCDNGYVVSHQGVTITLTVPAVTFLLLVDGVRTVENIEQVAASLGLVPPSGFLGQLLAALVTHGLAVWLEAGDLQALELPDTVHRCDGCGRSCQGHLVGPLPDSEIATIQRGWEELTRKVPALAAHKPLVHREDGGGVFLNHIDGKCVFLASDQRCAIHTVLGPAHKPSICRMFPYQRVLTETGVRLGISASCYRHYATKGSATTASELPSVTLDRESYQQLPLSAPPQGRAQSMAAHAIWDQRFATMPLERPNPVLSQTQLSDFKRKLCASEHLNGFLQDDTEVSAGFRRLLTLIEAQACLPESYAENLPHLRDMLTRMQFVRDTEVLGGPPRALALMLLGNELCAREPDKNDPAAERLVAWFRLLTTHQCHKLISVGSR